jgi:hypothetical protein
MVEVDLAHTDEPAFDELAPFGRRHPLELFRRNETFGPWHPSQGSHGIPTSS